jgi:acyl-CoA thioester hydrolase
MTDAADPLLQHTLPFRVRTYEVDENGHVNNAIYLQWAENLTAEHAEAVGFGRQWSLDRGGAWLVRRHEVIYRRPAFRGEEVVGTVTVMSLDRVRGVRRTSFSRATDGVELAELRSEWVWVRLSDGRPSRVPQELLDAWGPALAAVSRAD